jgi:hypothetical protein
VKFSSELVRSEFRSGQGFFIRRIHRNS